MPDYIGMVQLLRDVDLPLEPMAMLGTNRKTGHSKSGLVGFFMLPMSMAFTASKNASAWCLGPWEYTYLGNLRLRIKLIRLHVA